MKRNVTGILFLLILTMFAPHALGEEAVFTSGPYTYTVEDGGAVITGYRGDDEALVIPCTLDGYPVTAIGDEAFGMNDTLVSVVLPEGLMRIGGWAFYQCVSLTDVAFPAGLTSISDGAFCYCSELTSAVFAEGLQTIGTSAFFDCASLASVSFPASLESIGGEAFNGCTALTEVTYPESAEALVQEAFVDNAGVRFTTISE